MAFVHTFLHQNIYNVLKPILLHKGGIMDVAIRKLSEKNRTLMIYMFNTAYCIMKEELPYTLYTTMLKLQVKNGSDLARLKSYQSDKACAR